MAAAESSVTIETADILLAGDFAFAPQQPLIVFVHGSGSSRLSPRNQYVARALQEQGFSTLLFDLLTPEEEAAEQRTRHLRFDIPLLAERVVGTLQWLEAYPIED